MRHCNLKFTFYLSSVYIFFLILSGCSSYSPTNKIIGKSRTEVIKLLGEPDPPLNLTKFPSRLDFPRGPAGKHTYFVFFDNKGFAKKFEQVLNQKNFSKIKPGMTLDEVIFILGKSKIKTSLGRKRGFFWSYRYENPLCRWFQVEFTENLIVRSAGISESPDCRGRSRITFSF